MTYYIIARIALITIGLSFLFNVLTHHGEDLKASFEASTALFPQRGK